MNLGSGRPRQTHCKRGHEFTPENTKVWSGQRSCRACTAMREAARPRVTVTCPDCGVSRTRIAGRVYVSPDGVCQKCAARRTADGLVKPRVLSTDELRAWWRERFTQAEIDSLFSALVLGGFFPSELEEAA